MSYTLERNLFAVFLLEPIPPRGTAVMETAMAFFDSIFSFFGGGDDALSKNKRALKQIEKELNQNKYRKFYKVRTEEITPAVGTFFYEVYKTISTAQAFMKHAERSSMLKQITVEYFMNTELREIYDRLAPESIEKLGKHLSHDEANNQIQRDLKTLSEGLGDKAYTIDRCYGLTLAFSSFVSFDFFSILKKIDPRLKEYQFSYLPQYRSVNGKYLVEHIKDFLDLPMMEATSDEWHAAFEVMKKYRSGKNIIDPSQWKKVLASVQDIRRSGMLTLMVRHIAQDPFWLAKPETGNEHIVEGYLKAKTSEVQENLRKIIQDKQTVKRDALAKKLFGSVNITRLQYYTDAANQAFIDKNMDGFTYIVEMNYLKGFLTDHSDFQILCDLFLIRGEWASSAVSQQISQGLHKLTDIIDQVAAFDDALADNGMYGSKLKMYFKKSTLDKTQFTNLKVTLSHINNKAQELVKQGIASFTQVASHFKDLYEDCKENKAALIVNWKELESLTKGPIIQRLEQGYTMLEQFVHLLRFFAAEDE